VTVIVKAAQSISLVVKVTWQKEQRALFIADQDTLVTMANTSVVPTGN
jgi:hypothetical protein